MKKEQADEMLLEHIKNAKSSAMSLLVVIALLAVIIVRLISIFYEEISGILSFDIITTSFFIVGFLYIFTGVFFYAFEKAGE